MTVGGLRRRLIMAAVATGVFFLAIVFATYAVKGMLEDERPILSDDIVVGTWRAADGGEFFLGVDGTFHASGIPDSILGEGSSQSVTFSGTGTWKLASDPNDYSDRVNQVDLSFGVIDGRPVRLSARLRSESKDGEVVLFWFIGDPDLDRRVVYVKY